MGQSSLFVEGGDGGLAVGSELTGGGTQGVGGLQGVPPLNALAALLAVADVDVELAPPRLAGDFCLILVGHGCLDEAAAAAGTSGWQSGFQSFVDLVVGWWRPVAVSAVGVAAFASGCLGVGLGRPFAERSGLSFPGALCLFELAAELRVLGLQGFQLSLQLLDRVQEVVVGRPCHAHGNGFTRPCS